ncbi:hypothetical protein H9L39_09412 [Fusarium oxysporum f. sp. albedinis]|nr:hypothetical protein H9L39_09412 [Fusarium oxysporum f. sp. albedinis]
MNAERPVIHSLCDPALATPSSDDIGLPWPGAKRDLVRGRILSYKIKHYRFYKLAFLSTALLGAVVTAASD